MKMRRIIAYILVLVMVMGLLAGCGKSKNTAKTTKPKDKETKGTEYQETTEGSKATEGSQATEGKRPTTQVTLPPQPTAPTNPPSEPDCEHSYKEWRMDATCVSEGAKMQRCEKCGYIESSEKIDKLPHDNEWVVEKEATCKEFGQKYQQCKACKDIFVHILTEKADHIPDITGLKCKDCGALIPAQTN